METAVTQITGPHTANRVSAERQAAFDILLGRQSYRPLTDPGPGDAELNLIFDAALRAPDHGRLQPWRFAFIRGDARAELAEMLIDIAASREADKRRSAHEHRRQKAYAAPVIVALGASLVTGGPIPENEQLLSAGAATMNMLNTIHPLGYGGFRATGIDAYDAALRDVLDFEVSDRLIGFLFVGTPKSQERSALRPPRANHVREWLGRSSV